MKAKQKRGDIAKLLITAVTVGALYGSVLQAKEMIWHFDNTPAGQLPAGWKSDTLNKKSDPTAWQVKEDKSSPSSRQVLALTHINHNSAAVFNICRTDKLSFLDGEIEVKFKAYRGKIDQGGGVMWRVQDRKNYYIARFNPLEDNFRLYRVKNGYRKLLSTANITLDAGKWHTMKIVQKGSRYTGYLNGKKYLEGEDGTFKKPGGVGLWTKADAMTSFDDFSVKTK